MKTIALIAGALISAGAVSAESFSRGHAQFAATLNVNASQYSMTELINIEVAKRENDVQAERFFLSGANRERQGGIGQVSPGKAQFAAILGVDPASYSLAELTALSTARRENNAQTEAFILSKQNRVSRGNVGTVSPGKAQLAAGLGVNPAAYSLKELVALSAARFGSSD